MQFDVKTEQDDYLEAVRVNKETYTTDERIGKRTRRIFGTFARTMSGRSGLPKDVKEAEMNNLVQVTREAVVLPLLSSYSSILSSSAKFDEWHRNAVNTLKTKCVVRWNSGNSLTVGMAQKLINLHCKDLWALELVPRNHSCYFHAVIDQVTLGLLQRSFSWTKLDSYNDYFQLQLELRQIAQHENTYPLVLECKNWNKSLTK